MRIKRTHLAILAIGIIGILLLTFACNSPAALNREALDIPPEDHTFSPDRRVVDLSHRPHREAAAPAVRRPRGLPRRSASPDRRRAGADPPAAPSGGLDGARIRLDGLSRRRPASGPRRS